MLQKQFISRKKLPVATEISSDIHPEMIIDIDPLTPGVLSDDSFESASPHMDCKFYSKALVDNTIKKLQRYKNGKLI